MKLRLPSKLVAAIVAAAAAVTAVTVATGTAAYAATTYDNLTEVDYFESNANVYNTGKGTFYLETESCDLNLTLTLNLDAFAAYQAVHDYANSGYFSPFVTWTYNNNPGATYGMADVATGYSGVNYSGVTGYWAGSPWSTGTNITFDDAFRANYADANGNVTLTINNTPIGTTNNVVVTAVNNRGEAQTLYTANGLRSGSYESLNITSFTVNKNYVTSVTLNTTSTLDSSAFTPPKDYTTPFESQRTDGTTVGRILFMGDSITHGVQDMSWRWDLFKTMVDNGIEFEIAGPLSGYHSNPLNSDYNGDFTSSQYGGATFENLHYAQSSGRTHNMLTAGASQNALGNSTGVNYGGVSSTKVGQEYNADTYVMMMGTNDILSDGAYNDANMPKVTDRLLGVGEIQNGAWVNAGETSALIGAAGKDPATAAFSGEWGTMGQIIDNMQMGAKDTMYIMSIPTWGMGRTGLNGAAPYVLEYNEKLKLWVDAYNNSHTGTVKFVEVNKGLVDKTDGRFLAPDAFFRTTGGDYIHPNEQGALIIAGNLAQGMGLAGRTAGLMRADSHTANTTWVTADAEYIINAGDTVNLAQNAFTVNGGYTVDFSAVFGDGADNNWLAKNNALSISVGDGSNSGTLKLSEGYISWGDKLLYCQDNSDAANDNIRIAYQVGDAASQVGSGYYVWLGDMLIGQALSSSGSGNLNGITLSATGAQGTVSGLTYSNVAYAPTTTGITSEDNAFMVPQHLVMDSHDNENKVSGGVNWTGAGEGASSYATAATADAQGNKSYVVTLTAATNSWIGGIGSGNYQGNLNLKVGEGSANFNTAFGAVNAGTVSGGVTLELDSAATTIGSFTTGNAASVVGGFKASIEGTFKAVVNKGTLSAGIIGGFHSANEGNSIGAVDLAINGGSVGGTVYGGSVAANGTIGGTAQAPVVNTLGHAIDIRVTGGTINGSNGVAIVGSGTAGTVNGDIAINITGGVIKGDIIGKQAASSSLHYKDGVTASVTVDGILAQITGNISADNVTFSNVKKSNYDDAFDKYAGAVTAGDKLTLDNYKAAQVGSSVTAQRVLLTNNSATTIRNLTLTACDITAETGSALTLEGTLTLGNTATYSGNIIVADGLVFSMTQEAMERAAGTSGYSDGQSGFLTIASVTLLTPTDSSRLTVSNPATYTGAGALAGAAITYDAASGIVSAAPTAGGGSTYYVNSAVTYDKNKTSYEAGHFVINNGGNLTLATNLKEAVTIEGAAGATTSAITVGNGVTLAKASVSGDIASYVVNAGGVYAYGDYSQSNNNPIDFTSLVSGAGTVRATFTASGHGGAYVKTDANFTGTLDLSGAVHLKDLNTNTAAAATAYYLHGVDIWWNGGDITVAHNITFGGDIKYRPEGNATFSGVLTDDGSANFNWRLGGDAGNDNQKNKTVTLANAGAANLSKVTLVNDNLVLQQASGDTGTTLFTGNIVVNAGRTLTLVPRTAAGVADGEFASSVLHGGVWLNGTSASAATVYSDAKAFVIQEGIHLGDDAFGTLQFHNWGNAYIHGLEGTNGTLELMRDNNGGDAWATYVSLQSIREGAFSGTLKLSAGKSEIQAAVIGSPEALASTVVSFNPTGTAWKSVLAFADDASDIKLNVQNEIQTATSTFGNGTVAGLQSAAGSKATAQFVYADQLTVNTTADNSFAGTVDVNQLAVGGTGSQTLTGTNMLAQGGEVAKGATLTLGGTTTLGGAVANQGTLALGGTVNVTMAGQSSEQLTQNAYGTAVSNLVTNGDGYAWAGTDATDYALVTGKAAAADGVAWQVNGTAVAADAAITTFDGNTLHIENGSLGTVYHLNTAHAAYEYTAEDTRTTGFVMNGAGSTLTLNRDTTALTATPHIQVNAAAAIKLGESATLNKSDLAFGDGGSVTLSGNGAYALTVTGAAIANVTLGSNVQLSPNDWHGRVVLTNNNGAGTSWGVQDMTGVAFNALTPTADSWLELKDFKGFYAKSDQTFTSNIILTGTNALVISNGYSGKTYTFTGDIKGDGVYTHGFSGTGVSEFTGNIAGWHGEFKKTNGAGNSTTTLRFGGKAGVVNAAITNTTNYDLNIEAKRDIVFNNTVSAKNLAAAGHSVTLGSHTADDVTTHGSLTLTGNSSLGSLTLEADTTANISGNLTLGSTISNAGALTLNAAVTIGTDMNAYEVYQTGSSASTYSDGANGFLTVGDTQYYLVKNSGSGTTTLGSNFSISSGTKSQLANGDVVFTLSSAPASDVYYVNSGTVTGLKTDANTYVVANGAIFEVQGKSATGKTVILHEGATLASTGSGSGFGMQQLQNLYVQGDATIDTTTDDIGVIGSRYTKTDISLGGHTLTVKGGNSFFMANATLSGGSLHLDGANVEIQQGSNMVLDSVTSDTTKETNKLTIGSDAVVEVLGTTNVRSLSVEGASTATLDGAVTVGDEMTIKGSSKATFGDAVTVGGTMTIKESSVVKAADSVTVGTLAINGGATATFDGAVNVTGGTRTEIGTDNTAVNFNGGLSYTGSNELAILLNDASTVTFGGTTNLSGKRIGHTANSTVVFASDAAATVGNIYHSTAVASDGTLRLNQGAVVNVTGEIYTGSLYNSGTLTAGVRLHATNAYITGEEASVTLSGAGVSAITNLTIDGGSLTRTGAGAVNITNLTTTGATIDNTNASNAVTVTNLTMASGNTLTKKGAGTLTLNGSMGNALGSLAVNGGTLHISKHGTTQDPNMVKSDISVAAGATLKTVTNGTLAKSAAEALQQYTGKVTLNGTAEHTAKLDYTDGSTYLVNGLTVNGYGMVVQEWDKTQYIGGLYGSGELTMQRKNAQGGYPRYIVLDKSGDFKGTIKLDNLANAEAGGIIAVGEAAEQSLAGAVVNTAAGSNGAMVAFVTENGVYDDSNARIDTVDGYKSLFLTTDNLHNGTVAGLSGTAGSVYADTLTINTAEEGDYTYGGTLNVNALVKKGSGTQELTGTNTFTGNLTVAEGTLKAAGKAQLGADAAGRVSVSSGATLELTTALNSSDLLKEAITSYYSGEGTLKFKTTVSGNNFNDNTAQFRAGGTQYTQSIAHIVVSGNLGMNNNNNPNVGGLTIGEGKHLTVEGKLRVESDFHLNVEGGALTVTDSLGIGHTANTAAHVAISGEHSVVTLGGMTINNSGASAAKTFDMTGGTLSFTKEGNVFSAADQANNTASFTITGGTLKATDNSWNFNHNATYGNITIDTENGNAVTLGAAGTTTTLNGVIANNGVLALAGTVNVGGTLDTTCAAFSEGAYGYLVSVHKEIVSGRGRVDTDAVTAWTLSGMSAEQLGFRTVEYVAGSVLMSDVDESVARRWFMNTDEGGSFEYTAAEDQLMNSILVNSKHNPEGGRTTLTLNTGDSIATHLNSVIVNDTTAAINIVGDTEFAARLLMLANGGAAVLTGDGTFTLNAGTRQLAAGVSLDESWTGTVALSGAITGGHTFQDISNANSFVKLSGVTTWISPNSTVAANLVLDGMDNGQGSGAALNINGADSNKSYTFSGTLSGNGDMAYTQKGDNNDRTPIYNFTGSNDEWTGSFVNYNQGTVTVNMKPTADSELGSGVIQRGEGTMNLTYGEHATTVSGAINRLAGTLNMTVEGNTGFTGSVNASKVTVNAGKTADFSGGATLGGAELGANSVLSFTDGNNTLSGTVTADGTSSVSVSDATLMLQETADLTLPNLDMNGGATVHLYSAGAVARTLSLANVTVSGTDNTIDAGGNGASYHGQVDISNLSSAESGAEITLSQGAIVNRATVFNINDGASGAFDGTLHLKQGVTSSSGERYVALNLRDADALNKTVISMEAVDNGTSHVGLGIAEDVTVKGINTTDSHGEKVIFSGAANLGDQSLNSGRDEHTLTVNTDGGDYSAKATVKGNLNIVKTGAGTQAFTGNTEQFDGSLAATEGTLQFLQQATALNVQDLTITGSEGHTAVIEAREGAAASANADIYVSGKLTANEHAVLNGDLTLNSTASLELNATPTLQGMQLNGALTLNVSSADPMLRSADTGLITLSDDMNGYLTTLGLGDRLTLFTGVTGLNGETSSFEVSAAQYFDLVTDPERSYMLTYTAGNGDEGGIVALAVVPEPTTSALSLLALAGLAARRRRK